MPSKKSAAPRSPAPPPAEELDDWKEGLCAECQCRSRVRSVRDLDGPRYFATCERCQPVRRSRCPPVKRPGGTVACPAATPQDRAAPRDPGRDGDDDDDQAERIVYVMVGDNDDGRLERSRRNWLDAARIRLGLEWQEPDGISERGHRRFRRRSITAVVELEDATGAYQRGDAGDISALRNSIRETTRAMGKARPGATYWTELHDRRERDRNGLRSRVGAAPLGKPGTHEDDSTEIYLALLVAGERDGWLTGRSSAARLRELLVLLYQPLAGDPDFESFLAKEVERLRQRIKRKRTRSLPTES